MPSYISPGDVGLSDEVILNLAYQYLSADQLQQIYKKVVVQLAGLKNVYAISGRWFTVPHTRLPVRGKDPDCGNGTGKIDGDVVAAVAVIEAAAATIDILGGGGVASAIALTVDFFILSNNNYQDKANCLVFFSLIPGEVSPEWAREHVSLTYTLRDWQGLRQVSPGVRDWANIYPATVREESVKVAVPKTPEHDDGRCLMTGFFGKIKNWSGDQERSVKLDLLIDAFPPEIRNCGDHTILNRALYGHEIVECIPAELKQQLIQEYGSAIMQST